MRAEAQDGEARTASHVVDRAPPAAIVGRWVVGGALAALIIALMFGIAPRLTQIDAYRLAPMKRSDGSLELPVPLHGDDYAIYAPIIGGRARLEADGAEIANLESGALGGIGFNSQIVFAPVSPGPRLGEARLFLHTTDDHGRIGAGPVYAAPLAIAEAALAAQIQWAQRNQLLSIGISVAAAFLFTMRRGRQPADESAGPIIVLAYVVVAQALAKHPDVGAAFGRYIGGAEYILAIWAAFALAGLAAGWRAQGRRAVRRIAIMERALVVVATLCVLLPLQNGIAVWLPAALAAPALLLALPRAADGLSVRVVSWPAILKFSAVIVAAGAFAVSLLRAAEPQRWAQSFELTTVQSLGALPLLLAALGAYVASTLADRRESLARLQSDYAAQGAALAKANAALEEQARQRALLEERSRITRDMHDGIGGRLLSLLVRVRTGRLELKDVENEVQGSLNDLRLIVDSLDTAGETLGEALAEFRARAAHQLKNADINLNWKEAEGALAGVAFGPDATLNIFRIMQEAIANVVRHADATSVDIAIDRCVEAKALRILVSDDGRGMAQGARANGGKGLKYMDARARQLNGRIEIANNGPAGCRIELAIPLGLENHSSSGSPSSPS